MTVEAREDIWTIATNYVDRHYVEPRVKLHVPKEETFPIPLKYTDVVMRTTTTVDVLLESLKVHTDTRGPGGG